MFVGKDGKAEKQREWLDTAFVKAVASRLDSSSIVPFSPPMYNEGNYAQRSSTESFQSQHHGPTKKVMSIADLCGETTETYPTSAALKPHSSGAKRNALRVTDPCAPEQIGKACVSRDTGPQHSTTRKGLEMANLCKSTKEKTSGIFSGIRDHQMPPFLDPNGHNALNGILTQSKGMP